VGYTLSGAYKYGILNLSYGGAPAVDARSNSWGGTHGGNFIRFNQMNAYPLGYVVYNRVPYDGVNDFSASQVILEAATVIYIYKNAPTGNQNFYSDSGTQTGPWWITPYKINVDDSDLVRPGFINDISLGGQTYNNCIKVNSGNRILLFNNQNDWKINGGTMFAEIRANFQGGLNISDNSEYEPGYNLWVNGTIGAGSNITAYADYVCKDCGWHSAVETKECPNCGGNKVEYHDDVALLRQIIDAQSMYPYDLEKQYQAYQALEKLGVVDIRLDDKKGIREKDFKITQNVTAMNNYLISSIVQERKQSDKLAERIDKLEGIIEMFGYEPGKTNGLSEKQSYDTEDDYRFLYGEKKNYWNIYTNGTLDVVEKIKKKIVGWRKK
jgi:hypothetical protein